MYLKQTLSTGGSGTLAVGYSGNVGSETIYTGGVLGHQRICSIRSLTLSTSRAWAGLPSPLNGFDLTSYRAAASNVSLKATDTVTPSQVDWSEFVFEGTGGGGFNASNNEPASVTYSWSGDTYAVWIPIGIQALSM